MKNRTGWMMLGLGLATMACGTAAIFHDHGFAGTVLALFGLCAAGAGIVMTDV